MTLTPPDPIPAPVPMDAAAARTVLLTIAAMHGGTVLRVHDISHNSKGFAGYALLAAGGFNVDGWRQSHTWIWEYIGGERGYLRWSNPLHLAQAPMAMGRIDRGLN